MTQITAADAIVVADAYPGGSATFPELVAGELERARVQHPTPYHSWHEAYGVLVEEVHEFFDEVRRQNSDRRPANLLRELVQIAAVCQRAAECLDLTRRFPEEIYARGGLRAMVQSPKALRAAVEVAG